MVSRPLGFNTNLLLLMCLAALAGCQSPESKRQQQKATLRIHLETSPGLTERSQAVTVLRTTPMRINVDPYPVLHEAHVEKAEVVQTPGGFALRIKFNRQGQMLLEQVTTTNPNRRLAIHSQFGGPPDVRDRWLAAWLITRRIPDGILIFTPDADREEADQVALGLNNTAGAVASKSWFNESKSTGGAK